MFKLQQSSKGIESSGSVQRTLLTVLKKEHKVKITLYCRDFMI